MTLSINLSSDGLRIANGAFWLSGLLAAVVDLGVLEELSSPTTLEGLLQRLERRHKKPVSPSFIACALAWLERLGAIDAANGRYATTAAASASLDWLRPTQALWETFGHLRDYAFEHPNDEYYATLSTDEEVGFAKTMQAQLGEVIDELVGRIPSNAESLVDLGGSTGLLARRFCDARPTRRAVVIDSGVQAGFLGAAAGSDRVQFVRADISEALDIAPADCVALVRILHDWPDTTVTRVLAAARSALTADGTLLVAEEMYSSKAPQNAWPALLDIFLRCYLASGHIRTTTEIEAHLLHAGFRVLKPPEQVGWATVLLCKRDL